MAFWVPLLIFVATTALSMLLRPKPPKPPTTLPPAPDEDTTAPIPVVFGTQRVPMRWVRFDAQGMVQAKKGVYSFGIKVGTMPLAQLWWFRGSAVLTYGQISSFVDMVFDDRFWLSDLADRQHVIAAAPSFLAHALPDGTVVDRGSISYVTSPVFGRGLNLGAAAPLPYPVGPAWTLDGGDIFGLLLPDLYGGREASGGVVGYLTMRYGMRYPDLPHRLGGAAPQDATRDADSPPWRPFTWVDFSLDDAIPGGPETRLRSAGADPTQFRNGVTAYPPPIEFVVTRYPDGPVTGSVAGGGVYGGDGLDANPVTAIWELLTNPDIGLGMPEWMLDEGSFQTAALWTGSGQPGSQESNVNYLGVSFTLDQERTGEDVIGALLETLDAVLFTDLTTGKLRIWLIREPTASEYGYGTTLDPHSGLAVLTPQTARLVRWSQPEPREAVNVVRVKYRDRQHKFSDDVAIARNEASIAALGREQPLTIEPLGVATRVIAERVAKRELRARSASPRRATFELTRAHADLHVGKQFLAAFPTRGLDNVVMRVVSLDWGTPDDPMIRLEASEDVYGRPALFTLADPDPAPPEVFPFFRVPDVTESQSATASYGLLALEIIDPDGLVTGVIWQTKSGAAAWTPEMAGDPADPVQTVLLSADGSSFIRYVVTWTAPNGAEHEIDGVAPFGASYAVVQQVVLADYGAGLEPIVADVGAGDQAITSAFTSPSS